MHVEGHHRLSKEAYQPEQKEALHSFHVLYLNNEE